MLEGVTLADSWEFRTGRSLLAIALCGLGVIALAFPGPLGGWMPLPQWLPASSAIGRLMGLALLVLGMSLVILPDVRRSLVCVAGVLASWIVLFHPTRLVTGQFSLGAWLGVAEVGAVAAACWLLGRWPPAQGSRDEVADHWSATVAIVLYGVALLVFGMCHFVYIDITASMVPDWMPARRALAMFTGAGHIAAGLALLSGFLIGVATRLLTAMFATFVLLVHLPRVGGDPANRDEWLLLFTSLLLTASAWIMASILNRRAGAQEHRLLSLIKKMPGRLRLL